MIAVLALIIIVLLVGGVWGWPLVVAALGLSSATDKPSALKHIKQLMNTYEISPAEVEATFHAPASTDASPSERSKGDIAKTLFFAVVGMLYDQAHTRQMPELGGLMKVMPFAGMAFIIGGLVSMGMPGFSGFIAEFPIFMGVWESYPIVAVIAVVSIVITAAYILRAVGRVFFGELPAALEGHMHDISRSEKLALGVLCLVLVGIGLFPALMLPMVESGVDAVFSLLGGA